MSAFWIFAVCVTAAYVVYYTVMICIDLYSKPKDQAHANEEVFEIDETPSEESKAVEETDGGFRVASDVPSGWEETNIHPDSTEEKPGGNDDDVKLDATGAPMTPAQQKIEATVNDMEEIEPEMSGALMDKEFFSAMTTGKPPVPMEKTIVSLNKNETDNEHESHTEETEHEVSQIRDKI